MRPLLLALALWLGLYTPLAAQLREAEQGWKQQYQSADQKAQQGFPSTDFKRYNKYIQVGTVFTRSLTLDTAQWGIAAIRIVRYTSSSDTLDPHTWMDATYGRTGTLNSIVAYRKDRLSYANIFLYDSLGKLMREASCTRKQGETVVLHTYCDSSHRLCAESYFKNGKLTYKEEYSYINNSYTGETHWRWHRKTGNCTEVYRSVYHQDTIAKTSLLQAYWLVDDSLKLLRVAISYPKDSLQYYVNTSYGIKDSSMLTEIYYKDNLIKERSQLTNGVEMYRSVFTYDFASNTKTEAYYSKGQLVRTSKSYISWACDPAEKKRNEEGQTVDAKGVVSTYTHYYDDSADCRQRVYEQKDSKGRVTYKEVVQLDATNKPLREDTYDRKGKHVSSLVYSYTYY